jgi:hypothetical protein
VSRNRPWSLRSVACRVRSPSAKPAASSGTVGRPAEHARVPTRPCRCGDKPTNIRGGGTLPARAHQGSAIRSGGRVDPLQNDVLHPDLDSRLDDHARFSFSWASRYLSCDLLPRVRSHRPGAFSFAPFNHSRALLQLDLVLRVHARGLPIGPASNQQIDGAGEYLIGAVATNHLARAASRGCLIARL